MGLNEDLVSVIPGVVGEPRPKILGVLGLVRVIFIRLLFGLLGLGLVRVS